MTFIITLISLVIERFFHWSHLRHWRWFNVYQRWLSHSRISRLPSFVLFLVSVLPVTALVALINYFLNGWFYGVLKILFGIAILLYCLGPKNIWMQSYRCINQLNKEDDPKLTIDCVRSEFGIGSVDTSQQFHQAFTRAIFIAGYQRVFAVVFWFVFLGPAGAVLYRSITLMSDESPLGLNSLAKQIQQLLDWIPIRTLTFIFALGGHFTRVITCWKKFVLKGPETNEMMLTECGMAALDVENNAIPEDGFAEKDAISLLDRVFVIALVILAIVVLVL